MNIVFLDCTQQLGYQFSAANTKVEMLASGLSCQGDTVSVINGLDGRAGLGSREVRHAENIKEIITYPRPRGGALCSPVNMPALFRDLKRLFVPGEKNILVLETQLIHIFHTYVAVGHRLGYKIAVISHEWLPTVRRRFWVQNLSASLFARTFGRKADAILPISEYIIERIKPFGKPFLKTPVLAGFTDADNLPRESGSYFLYCVYAFYFRAIKTAIDGYARYRSSVASPYRLVLVLSGSDEQIARVSDYAASLGLGSDVSVRSKVPYADLLELYRSAAGLLIPLDPAVEQDKARFSQKIAEYVSTGVPVISNNVGEVAHYFTDRENIVLGDYSAAGFAGSFAWIQNHPAEALAIGRRGYELGRREFDSIAFGRKLHDFLSEI